MTLPKIRCPYHGYHGAYTGCPECTLAEKGSLMDEMQKAISQDQARHQEWYDATTALKDRLDAGEITQEEFVSSATSLNLDIMLTPSSFVNWLKKPDKP